MISVTTNLMPHQHAAVGKIRPSRVGALFMEMGTGKSRAAIELARLRAAKIDRVIWYCPVSVKETIRHEILKHTNTKNQYIYLFDNKTTAANLPQVFWYIIGIESMSSSSRVVLAAKHLTTERSMVIVDESDYIKGHRSKRTSRISNISEIARYRLILTGTPISQGVQDLFSQMKFLSPKILNYRSWHTFASNHLEYSDTHKGLIIRAHNTEWLAARMAPYVYQVTKKECLELPEKLYESRWCNLTTEQEIAYDAAKKQFIEDVLEYSNPEEMESSIPIFRLFTALQGIACGYIRDQEGNTVSLRNGRLELLLEIMHRIPAGEKVVIWAKYHHCINEIVNALQDDHVHQYHGKLTEKQRNDNLHCWRNSGRVLVGTQSTGQRGVDMTAASYVIFYANSFKYSERLQAEDRNHRIGQSKPVTYIDLWANCGIEDRISDALDRKGNVVSSFKTEIDKIKNEQNSKELLKKLVCRL